MVSQLAVWFFLRASLVTQAVDDIYRARTGASLLRQSDREVPWTLELMLDLELAINEAALASAPAWVLQQKHGDLITVIEGDMHAVLNLQPCFKVAVETLDYTRIDLMMLVNVFQAHFPGINHSPDYIDASSLLSQYLVEGYPGRRL